MKVPFNRPYLTGRELKYISEAQRNHILAGDGFFTGKCQQWLQETTASSRALLTHSCTAALEMAAILANLCPGDEVIMPSYTFVSTANAFVLRGAVPVFVDVREDTFNINEELIELAITERTRVIVPVHYAGVACEMDRIMEIAARRGLLVIEDAAQGIMSTYKGRALGSIGHMGALSFHETKNIISGEGGALLINDPQYIERAEIIREKGTNRSQFFRGQVDKYTWCDIGSSYLPGELTAAFLWAQMDEAERITRRRIEIWTAYHTRLAEMEAEGIIRLPRIPANCQHNAHMYYILFGNIDSRSRAIKYLKDNGIHALFHYVPLHDSPVGHTVGRTSSEMTATKMAADRLLRLPMWLGIESYVPFVCEKLGEFFNSEQLPINIESLPTVSLRSTN